MADNVAITAGSGTTVSTEEITTLNGGAVSAQHCQRVIPSLRTADGTAVDITSAAPMPTTELDSLTVGPTSVTSATTIFSTDMTGYQAISVQITAFGSGTVTAQCSNDNSTWVSCTGLQSTYTGNGVASANPTTTGVFFYSRLARYFRLQVTSYSSGTFTALGVLLKNPLNYLGSTSVQNNVSVIGAVNQAASPSASCVPIILNGYTANPTAVSTAQTVRPIATLVGVQVTKPYSIPEADVRTGATPITVTTSGQDLIAAAGAGVRNYATGLLITTDSTWTANTLRVRDGTTVLMEFDLPAGAGVYNINSIAQSPLRTTANTALTVLATGAVTGTCKVNAFGYQAP